MGRGFSQNRNVVLEKGGLVRAQDLGRSNVRFGLVIDPFVIP
jgi:hypothetical protein